MIAKNELNVLNMNAFKKYSHQLKICLDVCFSGLKKNLCPVIYVEKLQGACKIHYHIIQSDITGQMIKNTSVD